MKLWVISDWHCERVGYFNPPRPPEFDVLVCAGDVHDDILVSLGIVRALAGGKLAVFVAGNHEFFGDLRMQETIERGHAAARRFGIKFLECDDYDVGGVRIAGATLWTPDDPRFLASVKYLMTSRADIVVTHFPPPATIIKPVGAALWIYGHHHGFSVSIR